MVVDGIETQTQEVQVQEAQQVQESQVSENSITLDETGELVIPDSFWDAEETPKATEPEEKTAPEAKTEVEQPKHYTPEELAAAFETGNIDETRLKPEITEYYKAIAARRQAQAQRPQVSPMPPVQRPVQQVTALPPVSWDQVMEAGKVLAARNYLNINPDEFDAYDPKHTAAQAMAVNEIRERAMALQQQQVARQQIAAQVQDLYASYRAKVPEMDEISEKFFPRWKESLVKREYDAVDAIIASGNLGKIQMLFDRVISDYQKGKGNGKASSPPPAVVNAVDSDKTERTGMVSVDKLGEMSPEEQAAWLIANKFV
jgi:hypothetical protein